MSNYGRAFDAWQAASASWEDYVNHSFVQGLGDGTLPRQAFVHYLAQDYVFLIHFSRAWALAVVKAGSLDEMKAAASTVDALVNHEMALHVQICAEAGIDQAQLENTVERPENMAYTRYVLEAGFSGDLLDLYAALAPCVMGYGVIGRTLAAVKTSDLYGDWIGTYGGVEYQELCQSVGRLIDGALARRLGADFLSTARWPALQARFDTATRLEVGFWDMGLTG